MYQRAWHDPQQRFCVYCNDTMIILTVGLLVVVHKCEHGNTMLSCGSPDFQHMKCISSSHRAVLCIATALCSEPVVQAGK